MHDPNKSELFDAVIIGGGLAGLSLSILLAKEGYRVVLFEKEKYPFHKVCGEYISMESWNFINGLGLNLDTLHLPKIQKLQITSPAGDTLSSNLDLGGFGISRYFIDNELKKIAEKIGVIVHDATKVNEAIFENDIFLIKHTRGEIRSKTVAGTYGKRSNLDVKWKRGFLLSKVAKLNNYVGVKYHVKSDQPADMIALHNFKNGYCGISKIEGDEYCLCYLTNAENLKNNQNSVKQMEQKVLYKNPHLRKIFTTSEFIWEQPLTISQISFDDKTKVESHVLLIGDSAGMITPLCGNGMSMAMHGSKIASEQIILFLSEKITRAEMERRYESKWNKEFSRRLRVGRTVQKLFGKPLLTNLFISLIKRLPWVASQIIKATHGKEF